MADHTFNVRVYGIAEWGSRILLTDERRFGHEFTKFPGGGLEFGEGTKECLKREFIEEVGQEPFQIEHYYTTDFFQSSVFHENNQLISIYYRVQLPRPEDVEVVGMPFDFKEEKEDDREIQVFRWKERDELSKQELTFPIDKWVADKLTTDN